MRPVLAFLALAAHAWASGLFPNGTRNKLTWPYSSSSFWNTAIGAGATYAPAGINASAHVEVDSDFFIDASGPGSRETPWFGPVSWHVRCGESKEFQGWVVFPENATVPDATKSATPNNAAAILQPDGKTLVNTNPIARCEPGGPLYGGMTPAGTNQSIYGVGQFGGHGGSGLSSIGGTVRLGELMPGSGPILHALKWELWAERYYYNDGSGNDTCCHQWPAMRCDGYWKNVYGGTNPLLKQGSLLAVPPSHAAAVNATLTTEPARMLLAALVDFGAYVVDDTYWDAQQFCVENGLQARFEKAWGLAMTGALPKDAARAAQEEVRSAVEGKGGVAPRPGASADPATAFLLDVTRLSTAMHVVSNSAPDRVGGGGTPRVPAPPAIGN